MGGTIRRKMVLVQLHQIGLIEKTAPKSGAVFSRRIQILNHSGYDFDSFTTSQPKQNHYSTVTLLARLRG